MYIYTKRFSLRSRDTPRRRDYGLRSPEVYAYMSIYVYIYICPFRGTPVKGALCA